VGGNGEVVKVVGCLWGRQFGHVLARSNTRLGPLVGYHNLSAKPLD
jgi:hypothetical protein